MSAQAIVFALIVVLASAAIWEPVEVNINIPNLFPAGGTWDDTNQRFVVGSLTQGTLVGVYDDDANVTVAGPIGAPYGTAGVYWEGNTLYTCVNNAGTANSSIWAFDADTGHFLWSTSLIDGLPSGSIDASAPHLCNDVIGDGNGNLYAVDSYAPIIWTLKTDGTGLAVFSTDALYDPNVNNVGLGLDGIDIHPNGNYLLVMHYGAGYLMKVPLTGSNVGIPTKVTDNGGIGTDLLTLPDGIRLVNNGNKLLTTSGNVGEFVLAYTSDDDWVSMTKYEFHFDTRGGSAGIINRDGYYYVFNCHVNDLFAGTLRTKFEIERIFISEFFQEPQSAATGLFLSASLVITVLFSLLF